jgi:NADH dehydrogenase/NADH:ubiquinone oxidoreductase subunit G
MTDENEDGFDTEIEIETAPEEESDFGEDQFQKAEDATQKRINRLTKKMREAERQKDEALRYAQQVQTEADGLKSRISNLDTSYVQEYSTRVSTQVAQAEAALSRAMEMGDTKAAVDAQRQLTALAIQADRAEQAKQQQLRYSQQQAAAQQYQARQPMPAQQPRRPDPKAEQWALRNSWFGQDEAMTYAAFGIHKKLIEDEGFDPQSDEYYNELDRRISSKFVGQQKSSSNRPAQTVAGASRTVTSGRSGKKVRLTPSQVAIAKKLGVPLEAYAKYVKD